MVLIVRVLPAVEVKDNGVGVERLPIVERNALAQLEGVETSTVFRLGHLLGQRRYDIGFLGRKVQQTVKHLPGHDKRLTVSNVYRVEAH